MVTKVDTLRKKSWSWLRMAVLLLVMASLVPGFQWITFAREPLPEALAALNNDSQVEIEHDPWLTLYPANNSPATGFIFYPGGRIDPRGYSSLMKAIAKEGFLVVVPEMPLNIAAFKPNAADEIISLYPGISHWVIGGHSVGGTMAAQYSDKHREMIDGLAIWASYPANNSNLSDFQGLVISIYGTADPGVNDSSIAERKDLLPGDTDYIRIAGGDHHQFGSYLTKIENDHATIPRDSQHEQIVEATLELLREVSSMD
jgi:hypothetical protein